MPVCRRRAGCLTQLRLAGLERTTLWRAVVSAAMSKPAALGDDHLAVVLHDAGELTGLQLVVDPTEGAPRDAARGSPTGIARVPVGDRDCASHSVRDGDGPDVQCCGKTQKVAGPGARADGRLLGARRRARCAFATSPMIAASSWGRDHIGQWLVGRSTHVTSRSSGTPASQA
jgi:hypothetical protein